MVRYSPSEVEEHEHSAWEGAAPLYVEHIAHLTATSGQLELIDEAAGIERTDRVLDVGCGPGVLTALMRELTASVTGVDFSARMIDEARKLYPDIDFRVANAEELPFPDDEFDLAVVNYCAHHLARPVEAFREIRRVLGSGGRLTIVHPIQSRQPSWGSFANAVEEVLGSEVVPGGVLLNVEEPDVYVELLRKCGYDDVACTLKEKPVTLKNLDVLLNSGWTITSLHDQPQDVQDRVERGVRERAAPYRNDDDSFAFPDRVLVALGVA